MSTDTTLSPRSLQTTPFEYQEVPFPKMASVIRIDNFGDLTLALHRPDDGQEVNLLVSKSVMRNASSAVWDAMLTPGKWSEGSKTTLSMPEDDPDAMTIVQQIAHHKHTQVPRTLEKNALLQVAILCDKYDLFDLLALHYIDHWMRTKDLYLDVPDSLFLFYTFNQQAKFETLAKGFVKAMRIVPGESEDGCLVDREGRPIVTNGKEYRNNVMS